jgi:hypothetical protein
VGPVVTGLAKEDAVCNLVVAARLDGLLVVELLGG